MKLWCNGTCVGCAIARRFNLEYSSAQEIDLGGSKQDVYGQKCAVTCIPFEAHKVCPQGFLLVLQVPGGLNECRLGAIASHTPKVDP